MVLKSVTIENFLSIRGSVTLNLDHRVTVLLGANDHGKSNLIAALEHLNPENPLRDEDINWDAEEAGDGVSLTYRFELSPDERDALLPLVRSQIEQLAAIADAAAVDDKLAAAENVESFARIDSQLVNGSTIELDRTGTGQALSIQQWYLHGLPQDLNRWFQQNVPRVELFKALSTEIQDAVTAAQIVTNEFEFLQGIFYYAGLDPLNSEKLFQQTDATERALDRASARLDRELSRLWGQGKNLGLQFELSHRGTAIQFLANDPSVQSRKTRMSRRSAGVTQFFRISMLLHARRNKHPANSYIYLFDEPGVFLHPQGQRDLIQVFEELSDEAQVVYATHSLFLLNQNYPERHRLVVRGPEGTQIDQKPYRANWRLATDALGVHLTSNILFSTRILLVEGDSDPLHIYEIFRYFNRTHTLDADTNALGVFSFSDLPNLRFLLQIFKPVGEGDGEDQKAVMVLVDGDSQGKNTLSNLNRLCERLNVPTLPLMKQQSIEDVALSPSILLQSAIDTIRAAAEAEGTSLPDDWSDAVQRSWNQHLASPQKSSGKWFKDCSKQLIGDEASKVAWARNYVFACRESSQINPDAGRLTIAMNLCKTVAATLNLPNVRAERVVEQSTEQLTSPHGKLQ